MFCPECGSENDLTKRYCRRCGKSLLAVRLAIEGKVEEAAKALKGEQRLTLLRGRIVVALLLILIAVVTIATGGRFGFSNIQITSFILIIMVLVYLRSARKSYRVARALDAEALGLNLSASDVESERKLSTSPGNLNLANGGSNASVTEQETLKLKS